MGGKWGETMSTWRLRDEVGGEGREGRGDGVGRGRDGMDTVNNRVKRYFQYCQRTVAINYLLVYFQAI
jgi:hypothetical protein